MTGLVVHPKDLGLKFQRSLRKKSKPKKSTQPEAVLQALVEGYLAIKGVPYFRVPDSAYRAIFAGPASIGDKRECSEHLKGFPDLMLFCRGRFLALELKRLGGKLRPSQRIWRDAIGVSKADTFEGARIEIDAWLSTVDHEEKEN